MLAPDVRTKLSHRHLRFNAPLGDDRAERLARALSSPGAAVLDLGCGAGAPARFVASFARALSPALPRCE